ncbi:hypothetical protein [Streptomyces sp. NBC_00576]|uniref:hypothetical protein n=1 Tax=Streptomyces sp. NBC_00576 TaxID=2903665 RepID=UPI002E7FDEA4|nr:hypothetical protein [Streptomyces sp. NBC_00576]WUB68721.1 hypothetical protein OG734_00585 [Streptomyces sp. NBC_00576]
MASLNWSGADEVVRRRRPGIVRPLLGATVTRNVQGISGGLDAVTSATGDTVLQLTDIHGDVTVQLPLDTIHAPTALAYDEY